MGRYLLLLFLLVQSCGLVNQIDPERAALSRIEKKQWSAAEVRLQKALRKDSLSAEAKFLYARYYSANDNPRYSLDSADRYIILTQQAWPLTSARQRDRLQRLGGDSIRIHLLHERIDSLAFEAVKSNDTRDAYENYAQSFAHSTHAAEALELRNEVAYVDALKKNTPESYAYYIRTFPNSNRIVEAQTRFDKLTFEERTRSKTLKDYQSFLSEYPLTRHRKEVEEAIFSIQTASGLKEDYLSFLKDHPSSSIVKKAKGILYYIFREVDIPRPNEFDSDSLRILDQRNDGYWIPFYRNGLYGFMDANGKEVIEPRFESIDSTYLCGNVTQDFLVTSDGLIARSGTRLMDHRPESARDLGFGFIDIVDNGCHSVLHQSGFQVGDKCSEDARVVADQFLAIKKNGRWQLYAFNGKPLLSATFEDISRVDKLVVLKRSGKFIVAKASQIAATADRQPFDDSMVFDDVRAWGEGNLLVRNGVLEGVIGQDRGFVIGLDRQTLTKTSFGFIQSKDGRLKVAGISDELQNETFENVRDLGEWLSLINGKKQSLYRVSSKRTIASGLDSVWIRNRVIFGARADSVLVFSRAGKLASFEKEAPITFVPGKDSLVYFWLNEKKNKAVYEASQGNKLFVSDFDELENVDFNFFIFTKKNKKGVSKKGIIRRNGKVEQPAEYDVIVPTSEGYLSMLKEKKFGLYDLRKQLMIKAEYDRNVLPFSADYYVAYKGGYGVINAKHEQITPFEFEEIRQWNDTSAWVKKNFFWAIYSFKDGSTKINKVRDYHSVSETAAEKVVIIRQDNYFGVISSKRGRIIPSSFTEVINLGSPDRPLYFTEKRVEEAGIYVVIYYNSDGKLIRKQVYEEGEYDKIYCDN